ncbi:glycosyltransferase family 2 protein [Lonsdalea quercina]|uniref:glycosyltransferase family 2 protein n=1 Tax=Lonsdalea quercina TaxID=71657 RepID=UPI003976B2AD
MKNKFQSIAAIIVTFNPELESLNALVDKIKDQVDNVIIIDNSELSQLNIIASNKVDIILLNENKGIATAQNIGIKKAFEKGMQNVIFFDQDTTPSDTLIFDLLQARIKAEKNNIEVAAIGPVHFDTDTNCHALFVKTTGNKLFLLPPDFDEEYLICDFVISSGCLIKSSTLKKVGLMEDELFIDCVDIEWGFRAKSLGMSCLVANSAHVYHKIGDKPLMILNRALTTHSPIRHYYFYRNFYLLMKREYVPLVWKTHVFIKSCIQACMFSLFLSPRIQHLKMIIKGVYHGITGRLGKYEK